MSFFFVQNDGTYLQWDKTGTQDGGDNKTSNGSTYLFRQIPNSMLFGSTYLFGQVPTQRLDLFI